MLDLPGVTLVCIDCANHALALRAMARSLQGVRFGRALFLTDVVPAGVHVPTGVDIVSVAPIRSRDDYSHFMIRSLLAHVATSHALVIQWDGYVVNPSAWDPANLACDYLGAKWFWHDDDMRVGNGGFSLRSRRLLEALQDPRIVIDDVEDNVICRKYRRLLENDHGIRFGSEALADRFSFEAAHPIGTPFGFHGLFNFWRTVPADELAALAAEFSDAIAKSPQALQLARNCATLGLWPAAAALARRIIAADPERPDVAALLANAERNLAQAPSVGRNDPCPCGSGRKFKHCHGALDRASAATAAAPPMPLAPTAAVADIDEIVHTAVAAHQRGELDAAERRYRDVLVAAPDHPLAMHYLGVILYQRQKLDEALPLLERSCAAAPEEPEFHNNLGLALAAADRNAEAVASYRKALALKPDHTTAWNNLGLALTAMNQPQEAIAAYRESISIDPDFAQAHWNLGLALLLTGRFREGWNEYEWRLRIPELGGAGTSDTEPFWDGKAHPGLTLLLGAEQGMGDALQFIRLAEPLAWRGVRVIVSTEQALVRLFTKARGVAAAIGPRDPVPAHEARLPLLSLPGILDIDEKTIPATVPYLTADPARRAMVAASLAPYAGRRKLGLVWAGNRAHANDRRRSATLAELAPLFGVPGIAWFSLQRGQAERDIDSVPAAASLVPLPPTYNYDDTAALVAELDLVIAVDTGIAHLAGALGKPIWVMLPFAPDWRWQLGRADNPWYPTMRLFRQPSPGAWDAVARDVVAALSSHE